MKDLRRLIRGMRLLNAVKQREVAKELGVSEALVSKWEVSKSPPPDRALEIIEAIKQIANRTNREA